MIANTEKFYLGKRSTPKFTNQMFHDSDIRMSLYPCQFQSSSFDLNFDMPAVDDVDLFDNLCGDDFKDEDDICDSLSLKMCGDQSEIRSLSELEFDGPSDDFTADQQKDLNFEDKSKILENCPEIFKNTARDINTKLNSKLKNQFEEIHCLLDKMAEIVIKTEPKKSSFILDCRTGTKTTAKGLGKRNSKAKKAADKNKTVCHPLDAMWESDNGSLPELAASNYELSIYDKKGSMFTASTAPTKKLKSF
jgi:hypothetical protein